MSKNSDKQQKLNAKDIQLIVYDFDGVMTNNRVIVSEDGKESVIVNRADGLGVSCIRKLGIHQLIMTTETNPVVRTRAKKLKLEVIDSCKDKRKALQDYCSKGGYDLARVVFVGNDINDLEVMEIAGFSVAPSDASQEILSLANLVTNARGGHGVVRELLDCIVKNNG